MSDNTLLLTEENEREILLQAGTYGHGAQVQAEAYLTAIRIENNEGQPLVSQRDASQMQVSFNFKVLVDGTPQVNLSRWLNRPSAADEPGAKFLGKWLRNAGLTDDHLREGLNQAALNEWCGGGIPVHVDIKINEWDNDEGHQVRNKVVNFNRLAPGS